MTIKEPNDEARYAMIWLHGLGASGQDMAGLVEAMQIQNLAIRHVFLDAPSIPVTINQGYVMPAWYDIKGDKLTDREDEPGILKTDAFISEKIHRQHQSGIAYENIFVCGFSQGGAMSLYSGLRFSHQLAGIVALSCYLPLAKQCQLKSDAASLQTPVFMAYGEHDPIVLPAWSKASHAHLLANGMQSVQLEHYPMEHSICMDELQALKTWLIKHTTN